MRPRWCPHRECAWVTGGESGDGDSGCACAGRLQSPRHHGGDQNTHRLCLKQVEPRAVTAFEVNATDLWYLGRIVSSAHADAKAALETGS